MNRQLFGINSAFVNENAFVLPNTSWTGVPGYAWGKRHWVDHQDSTPYTAPLFRETFRLLRVANIRFPGGGLSTCWSLLNGKPVSHDYVGAHGFNGSMCDSIGWLRNGVNYSTAAGYAQDAYSWRRWLDTARDLNATTTWVLNPLGQTVADNAAVVSQIINASGGQATFFEYGNELYDRSIPGSNLINNASSYMEVFVRPILDELASEHPRTTTMLIGSPCDMFWRQGAGCWAPFYQRWNGDLGAARRAACDQDPQQSECTAGITAHNYRLDLNELARFEPAAFSTAFLAFPEATMANAAERMRQHFPLARLHVTETNIFWPSIWNSTVQGGLRLPQSLQQCQKGCPQCNCQEAAAALSKAPYTGLHALYVAGMLLSGVNNAEIAQISTHGWLTGCSVSSDSKINCPSQPGFGMVSLDVPGNIAVSAPAQIFAHLSEIARRSTSMHAVHCTGGPVLNLTVAERENMSVLQAAAFSSLKNLTVAILSRSHSALPVSVSLPSGLVTSGPKSRVAVVHYAAHDPGGFALMNASTALRSKFPWAGPLRADHSNASAEVGQNEIRLQLSGAGLYIIEVSSTTRAMKTRQKSDEVAPFPQPQWARRTVAVQPKEYAKAVGARG